MEMNNAARVQLVAIVRQDGINILENEQRLRGLLMDKCPEARREMNVVLAALQEKVPHKLHEPSPDIPKASRIATQTQRLVDTRGLDREVAKWAVETWVVALETLSKADSSVSQGTSVSAQAGHQVASIPSKVSVQSNSNAKTTSRANLRGLRRKKAKWEIAPRAPTDFLRSVKVHPLMGQILYNRGLRSAGEVDAFLHDEDAAPVSIFMLADMKPALQRILRAISQGETICVYGNSSVDGVASTVLLVTALRAASGNVDFYIPDFVDDGFGLNRNVVTRIAAKVKLLVTVDCGTRSLNEIAHALLMGMDVIVTDHHTVGPLLPLAQAVINPRRSALSSRFYQLAGVGVAYRLAQAVLRVAERFGYHLSATVADIESRLIDLASLGTVADVMPLLGENRTLVRRGLKKINDAPRPGLVELMRAAGLQQGTVDSTVISRCLAPRLNAAGYLHHARLAYDLLRTCDSTKAHVQANAIEDLYHKWCMLTEAAQIEAEQQIAADLDTDSPLLMAASPSFEHGIVGAVAASLVERYHRPAVVLRLGGEIAFGSVRSIPGLDISRALDAAGGLLVGHSGYPLAADFTVKSVNLPALRNHLSTLVAQQLGSKSKRCPKLEIDAEVSFDQLSLDFVKQLADLEPVGEGNSWPLLLSRNCRVQSVRWQDWGRFLVLGLKSGSISKVFHVLASQWSESRKLTEGSQVDIVFQVAVTCSNGCLDLQMKVIDLRPTDVA